MIAASSSRSSSGPLSAFAPRSEERSAFRQLFANPWLWASVGLALLLQVAVIHVGFLNVAFGTVALDPAQWLTCAAMGSVVLWFGELRKLLAAALRRERRRRLAR